MRSESQPLPPFGFTFVVTLFSTSRSWRLSSVLGGYPVEKLLPSSPFWGFSLTSSLLSSVSKVTSSIFPVGIRPVFGAISWL